MKRLIMIEIAADSRDCGKCVHKDVSWCSVFRVAVHEAPMGGVWSRAKECMDAERRARAT